LYSVFVIAIPYDRRAPNSAQLDKTWKYEFDNCLGIGHNSYVLAMMYTNLLLLSATINLSTTNEIAGFSTEGRRVDM
jgi:hypothetical protein